MKSILITGASSGIGAACARLFLDTGWRVGLLARRRDKLEEVAQGHENARVFACDVTDAAAVEAATRDFAEGGPLDVLFNNAGLFAGAAPIDEMALEDWHRTVDVNLHGMVYAARAAFAVMRAQGHGRIINNGSISAYMPREHALGYTVTKHAITGLTRQLALDGRAVNIACGQIDVGNARTEMVEHLIEMNPDVHIPTMEVADVARSVLHMADLPMEANVLFMTVMAKDMEYVGRG